MAPMGEGTKSGGGGIHPVSVTGTVTQAVFWGHVVGAVLIGAAAVAVGKLVEHLDLAPAGIESAPWARVGLERGVPAGVGLFALAVLGYGFAFLEGELMRLDPGVSELGTLERLALTVPGGFVGRWGAIAALAVFNVAVVLFLLDLGYRWATAS